MTLKYAGPKPIISHKGIAFDNNKEDKYIYLNVAVQILKSLNHEYLKDKIYAYDIKTQRLSESDILHELGKYCTDINSIINTQNHNIEDEVDHMVQRAHENMVLSEDDKIILENNINIMHNYLVQRSINKRVYYCVIDQLAEIIKKEKIDYIIVPMFQTFFHTLHSLQGSLIKLKQPILSNLDIYKESDDLLIKLSIQHSL